MSFCYLDWLAQNSLSLYYNEYLKINGPIIQEGILAVEEAEKYTLFPFNDEERYSLLLRKLSSYGKIRIMILRKAYELHPELYVLSPNRDFIWVKAEVLASELIDLDTDAASSDHQILVARVRIVEAIGEYFPEKEIVIRTTYSENDRKEHIGIIPLRVGREYLLPIIVRDDERLNEAIMFQGENLEKGLAVYGIYKRACFIINEKEEVVNTNLQGEITENLLFAEGIKWDENEFLNIEGPDPEYDNLRYIMPYAEMKAKLNGFVAVMRGYYEQNCLWK
jgi:hypothetical protein